MTLGKDHVDAEPPHAEGGQRIARPRNTAKGGAKSLQGESFRDQRMGERGVRR